MTGFRTVAGPLATGALLGRGGEGEVFAIEDGTGRALKVFAAPDAGREAKVRAMIADGLALTCPDVAFPREVAFGPDGTFAGFTMRLVRGRQPIHELYSPGSRRDRFPRADWRFIVRAATNLARVFAQVHATGSVIGDVNGTCALVSERAAVMLIDADSFQRGPSHLCRVGVPEYTPPELQGRRLDGVRTVNHDAFGLAVLVFQLLFLGRHPFAGIARGRDLDLAEAIRRGRFAYTRLGAVGAAPPSGTLRLADLPPGIRLLFERAFLGSGGLRPRPADWVEELARLEAGLSRCLVDDRHATPRPGAACPWCRIERGTGKALFGAEAKRRAGPPAPGAAQPSQAALAVRAVAEGTLRRAKATTGEAAEPRPRPADGGAGAGPARRHPPLDRSTKAALKRHRTARDELAGALDTWRREAGAWRAAADAARLADMLAIHAQLEGGRDVAAARALDATVRERLALEPLSTAAVPGVGPRRRAALQAAGVVTAADATREALDAVRGLGSRERVAILLWRDGLSVRIGRELAADPVASEAIARRAAREHRAALVEAERAIGREAGDLQRLLDDVAARTRAGDRAVDKARAALASAESHLDHLGIRRSQSQPGGVPALPGPAVPARTKRGGKRKGNGAAKKIHCPVCASPTVLAPASARSSLLIHRCVRHPTCTGSRPVTGKP